MSKEIKGFECDFCKKFYRSERGVKRHEQFCTRNPQNHNSCGMCKHFKEEKITRPSVYDFEIEVGSKQFVCTKFDRLLYSASMEGKGYLKRYPSSFEGAMKMPAECPEFKGNWLHE